MLKRFAFIQSISLLHTFEVCGQFCSEGITKEEILRRYFESEEIDLEELYMLNAPDRDSVIDELTSQYLCYQEQLPVTFIQCLPYFARVPDCFQRLCDSKSIRISVEPSPYSDDLSPKSLQRGVDEFIESISLLDNVHYLCLDHMKLVKCPAGVSKLKPLKWLCIDGSNLHSGSFDGIQLPDLEELCVCDNVNLRDFPEGVLNFTKLKRLSLEHCSLSSIPASIGRLQNLEVLALKGNRFKSFPPEIHSLKSLDALIMSNMELMASAEIDLVLSPRLVWINLSYCCNLNKVVVNIPEKGLRIQILDITGSRVYELVVSPNLAFSEVGFFRRDLPRCLPPSCGDQLGWPGVIELCGSQFGKARHRISAERLVEYRWNLSLSNRFYWKPNVLEICVLDLKEEELDKDGLLYLWNIIVGSVGVETSGIRNANYECSVLCLRNLYGEPVEDPESIIKFTYVQYKPTVKILLSALFKKIRNSNLEISILKGYVESILEMFQRQQGEQLVYFYHLLKSLYKKETEVVRFEEFIQNSIAILKDYIFTMTVNLRGCDKGLLNEYKTRAKSLGLIPDKEVVNFERDDEHYKSEMLPLFNYKFSPDWFCRIVAGVINSDEELKRQALWYISGMVEDPTVYFEYEEIEGSKFAEKFKEDGVSTILMKMGLIGNN